MASRTVLALPVLFAFATSPLACAPPRSEDDGTTETSEKPSATSGAITSDAAKILSFDFSAEVVAPADTDAHWAITSQLMFIQGILTTAGDGNGQIGHVSLSGIGQRAEGDRKRFTYRASLPVAFPKDRNTPGTYELVLPADVSALSQFTDRYADKCGNTGHGRENFWMDWNPKAGACNIDDGDVVRARAVVSPSSRETRGKYPEYDLLWADGRLDVVAVFGIITSNKSDDWGHTERAKFLDDAKNLLGGATVHENATSGSILKDTTITGTVGSGQRVEIDILLVQEVKSVGGDFDARFDPLSENADVVMYNGHAGLGSNVNAFAHKGRVAAGKYQIVLLNGCQTFAHIDRTLNDRRVAANGADRDPAGTRYLDVVGNALANGADHLADVATTLLRGLANPDRPRDYNDIISSMPSAQLVVVFGEEDNRFSP